MRSERLKYYCTYRASILERTPVGVPLATLSRRSGSCECHVESGCRSARVLPPSFRSCSSAVASGRAVPMWARSAIGGSPSIAPGSSIRFVITYRYATRSPYLADDSWCNAVGPFIEDQSQVQTDCQTAVFLAAFASCRTALHRLGESRDMRP